MENHLEPSADCYQLIKSFEGLHKVRSDGRIQSYLCPAGVWTIGYGATGPGIGPSTIWTLDECEDRLERDVDRFASGVRDMVTSTTSQAQFDALVSFAYNVGLGGFKTSTLLKRHNAGAYDECPAQIRRWVKANGKVLKGLVRRRAAEAELYGS